MSHMPGWRAELSALLVSEAGMVEGAGGFEHTQDSVTRLAYRLTAERLLLSELFQDQSAHPRSEDVVASTVRFFGAWSILPVASTTAIVSTILFAGESYHVWSHDPEGDGIAASVRKMLTAATTLVVAAHTRLAPSNRLAGRDMAAAERVINLALAYAIGAVATHRAPQDMVVSARTVIHGRICAHLSEAGLPAFDSSDINYPDWSES